MAAASSRVDPIAGLGQNSQAYMTRRHKGAVCGLRYVLNIDTVRISMGHIVTCPLLPSVVDRPLVVPYFLDDCVYPSLYTYLLSAIPIVFYPSICFPLVDESTKVQNAQEMAQQQ